MNSFVFNPKKEFIYEWIWLYVTGTEVNYFQLAIDRLQSYLNAFSNIERNRSDHPRLMRRKSSGNQVWQPPHNFLMFEKEILNETEQVQKMLVDQQRVVKGHNHNIAEQSNPEKVEFESSQISIQRGKKSMVLSSKVKQCMNNIRHLKHKAVVILDKFLSQESELIESFVAFKIQLLRVKLSKIDYYLSSSQHVKNAQNKLKIVSLVRNLFDNLFIEGEYLHIFIHTNVVIFQRYSCGVEGQYSRVDAMKRQQLRRLRFEQKRILELKKDIRQFYLTAFARKKKMMTENPERLQENLKQQIAVNGEEYEIVSPWITWSNGFLCAVIIFAMIAIIVFRQINILQLEKASDYKIQFKVWRGASYLIWFNWVFTLVFFLVVKWKINYKLVLLEKGNIIGKYQSFFWTSVLLSTIYMVLFLTYLLSELGYIPDHPQIKYMGYFMWIINIVFLLNPFKILNYHSRFYFLTLFKKLLCWQQHPTNPQLDFLILIIGSCAQPFNDFSYTVCSLVNFNDIDCQAQSRTSTFVFVLVYFVMRIIRVIRIFHITSYARTMACKKGIMKLIAIFLSINTVVSGFKFRSDTRNSSSLMIYWILSVVVSTLAETNAELRADWFIGNSSRSQNELKHARKFPYSAYYIAGIVNFFLNVDFTLTMSNSVEIFLNINVLYFFMLLGFIELWRRGMWMVFKIDEMNSHRVTGLEALADDTYIVQEVQRLLSMYDPSSRNESQIISRILPEKVVRVKQQKQIADLKKFTIIQMVLRKQRYIVKIQSYLRILEQYIDIAYKNYEDLIWQQEK